MKTSSGARVGANEARLKPDIEALAKKRFGDASVANMKKLFDQFDGNHDGKINKTELTALLEAANVDNCSTNWVETCPRWAKAVIERLDKNGDGQISWEEYKAAAGYVEAPPPPPPPPAPPSPPPTPVPPDEVFDKSIADEVAEISSPLAAGALISDHEAAAAIQKAAEAGKASKLTTSASSSGAALATTTPAGASLSGALDKTSGDDLLYAAGAAVVIGALIYFGGKK